MVGTPTASWTRQVAEYIDHVLGVGPLRWHDCGPTRLPVYLAATFDTACTELLDTPCAFAFRRASASSSPTTTAKQLTQLATILDRLVVLVEPTIPSWRRRRLIERRVAFVAPSTQLYLPPLGIDLRDAVRSPHNLGHANAPFAPSTQVVLLDLLLDDPGRGREPETVAQRVRFSTMSISRAVRALEGANLIERPKHGRSRRLRLRGTPKDVWERAQPFLVSPVRARFAADEQAFPTALDAGETALANQSMLAPPPIRTVAVSGETWTKHAASRSVHARAADVDQPGSVMVEVWTYPPESLSRGSSVDPLSLYLSLREHDDARIERARDTLTSALE